MGSVLDAMLARVPDVYDKSVGSIFYDTLEHIADRLRELSESGLPAN